MITGWSVGRRVSWIQRGHVATAWWKQQISSVWHASSCASSHG